MKTVFAILCLALILSVPGVAQDELLPDGAYGATIHGGMKAGEKKSYILHGTRGQVFKAHVTTRNIDKGASLELHDSQGESLLAGLEKVKKIDALDLILPKEDAYQLLVKAGPNACSYVLEVTLEDTPPPKPKPKTKTPRRVPKPTEVEISPPESSPALPEGRPSKAGP